MRCPVCKTDTLLSMDHEGVTLDFCSGCKGVWFDEGETAFYVETTVDVPHLDTMIASGRPSAKECPRCAVELTTIRYLPDATLELDVCGKCRGIYLDRGELPQLEKLAARLQVGGKVQRTMQALEARGYVVLGVQPARRRS